MGQTYYLGIEQESLRRIVAVMVTARVLYSRNNHETHMESGAFESIGRDICGLTDAICDSLKDSGMAVGR